MLCIFVLVYLWHVNLEKPKKKKKRVPENMSMGKTYFIRKVGVGGVKQDSEKKKASVGLFSTFCHPLVQRASVALKYIACTQCSVMD